MDYRDNRPASKQGGPYWAPKGGPGSTPIYTVGYSTGCHTTFHHRYHIVWAPKYRYKVLHGEVRIMVREIIRQVCGEMGVTIINGALSRDHVHMFVEIPPHVSVSDFVRRAKGRSSRKIQQEFEHIRKLLGPALLGQGILLHHLRQHHR